MQLVETICSLLNEKKTLFAQYEAQTIGLCTCAIDDTENYITKRSQLANEIDKKTEEIKALCFTAENGEILWSAVLNRCNFGDVPVNAQCIFSAAQECFAIINRVAGMEPAIMDRMKSQQEGLLEKIKSSQNTPKIQRYLTGLTGEPAKGTYLGQKYDKV